MMLADREAELEKLKAQEHSSEKAQKAARAKWKAMEEEIATLQVQLAAAEQERDELKVELQETLVELKKQVKKTQKFKAKAKEIQGSVDGEPLDCISGAGESGDVIEDLEKDMRSVMKHLI